MIFTLGTVSRPSFLTLIASISLYKPFQRHTRLWASRLPQVSTSCSQQRRLFHRPEPQCKPRAVIFRYISLSSSNASNEPNKQRDSLPSEDEGQRSNFSKKFSHLMDNVQSNIFFAGQRLNDLTGYSGIEALKWGIEEQGQPCFIHFIYSKIIYLTSSIREESSNYPYLAPAVPRSLLSRNIPKIHLSARGQ